MTGAQFLITELDEKLIDEDLNAEGAAFALAYYGATITTAATSTTTSPPSVNEASLYSVPDTWEHYERLAPAIDARYARWVREGRPQFVVRARPGITPPRAAVAANDARITSFCDRVVSFHFVCKQVLNLWQAPGAVDKPRRLLPGGSPDIPQHRSFSMKFLFRPIVALALALPFAPPAATRNPSNAPRSRNSCRPASSTNPACVPQLTAEEKSPSATTPRTTP